VEKGINRIEMKDSSRITLLLLLSGVFLFLGILMRSFLLENMVKPIGIMLLLLGRILSSVDQQFYWGFLFALLFFYIFFRFFQAEIFEEEKNPADPKIPMENIRVWRTLIAMGSVQPDDSSILKRDLARMLATVAALQRADNEPPSFFEALRQQDIPLPEYLWRFLSPTEGAREKPTVRERLESLGRAPGNILRRWTGRDKIEYAQRLKELISFLEEQMEMQNGEEYFHSLNH
jgi:hypothetical protein